MTQRMAPPQQSPLARVPIGGGQPNLAGISHRCPGHARYAHALGSVKLPLALTLDRLGRHGAPVPILRPAKRRRVMARSEAVRFAVEVAEHALPTRSLPGLDRPNPA